MALSESELIERYFRPLGAARADVVLGIGDDAALLTVPPGSQLVVTTDALVEGVHFLPGASARALGHRALAVNLSDIAAMGAAPAWMLLSLILPEANEGWLGQFVIGLAALARREGVALVGGNLSRGPLSITITLLGQVPPGAALRRDGARPGDLLYVSGTLGDAAAGRELVQGQGHGQEQGQEQGQERRQEQAARPEYAPLRERFESPQPRVALGQALRGLASACIDLSDGLYVDAARLLHSSGCGGQIDATCLPLSNALRAYGGARAPQLALGGGEDYELLFSAAAAHATAIEQAATGLGERITRIGTVSEGTGLGVNWSNDATMTAAIPAGFDHFGR
jgi:thiamine-monophosphate kinase